jgi:hypothetical protein
MTPPTRSSPGRVGGLFTGLSRPVHGRIRTKTRRRDEPSQEVLLMSIDVRPKPAHSDRKEPAEVVQVIVYGHSALFYWWPLWVAGYVMALLTWWNHDNVVLASKTEWFHPSRNLGVVFTLLLLLITVVTGTKIKGMKAALIIAAMAFCTLLFIHLNWWDSILGWLGQQSISMSFGFYFFYSSLLLITWIVSVFAIDHMSFWRFRPGQITHEYLGGIVENSYDTDNMTFTLNRQDDFFRHWFIGFASGDLHMRTMGGQGVELKVENVLFVGAKMFAIQRLIATKPDEPQRA